MIRSFPKMISVLWQNIVMVATLKILLTSEKSRDLIIKKPVVSVISSRAFASLGWTFLILSLSNRYVVGDNLGRHQHPLW